MAIDPANTADLSLSTGGTVTQAAAITQAGLSISSVGAVTLNSANVITTLAANVTGSGNAFSFTDSNAIDINTVDARNGVKTNGGTITITTTTGTFTVSQNIVAGAAAVNLTAGTADQLLDNNAAITGNAATFTADNMALEGGTIAIGGGVVTLKSDTTDILIDLGSGTDANNGNLELSDTELDTITAASLKVGDTVTQGNIVVTAALTVTTNNLLLLTTGAVSQGAGDTITVSNLHIDADETTTLTEANDVTSFLAVLIADDAATFSFTDANILQIGPGFGINGVATTNGAITLVATTGGLTVFNTAAVNDVDAGTSTVSLQADGGDQLLTISETAVVTGTGGVTYIADNMTLAGATSAGALATLVQNNAGQLIGLGAVDSGTTLGLTDAELNTVTATVLRVGDVNSGAMSINAAIDTIAGGDTIAGLTLITGGTVTQTNTLRTRLLRVSSAGATLTLANDVTTIAAAMINDGTDFSFTDVDGFTVATVDTVVGITTAASTSDSGDITMSGAGAILINAAMTTGTDTIASTAGADVALTGSISVTSTGSTITGDANGILTTGVATTDAAGGGVDTATSGSITLSASGAIQLAATNALVIGNATANNVTGGDDIATTGNIVVTTAAKISSDGANADVDVSFGTATATGGTATAGVLRATTTGGAGDAGGIFFTSGEALTLGVLDTADGTSQNIDIEVAGGATLTVAEASTLDTDSLGLFADVMAINAALSAGSVDIADSTGGIAIDLGTEAGGELSLTDTEIDQITATNLRIGEATSGAISISAAITPADNTILSLLSDEGVLDDGGAGSIAIINGQLSIDVDTAVSLTSAANNVTSLAANVADEGNNFIFTGELDGFTVTTVDGVTGITTAASTTSGVATGVITLSTAAAGNGNITISSNVTTGTATVAEAGAGTTATSGAISVTAGGTGDILGAAALVTGDATVTGGDGDDTATVGNITLVAEGVSGITTTFGTATSGGGTDNAGQLGITTNGTAAAGDIVITSAAAFTLGVLDTDDASVQTVSITVTGGAALTVAGTSTLDADNVTLAADVMDVAAGITTTGIVTLAESTGTRAIDIGSLTDLAASLELSNAELDLITAGTLRVGSSDAGAITISAPIDTLNTSTLHLISGAGISGGTNTVTETNLAFEAAGSIDADTVVSTVAATTTSGGVDISNTGNLDINTVDAVVGIVGISGVVTVTAASNITVTNAVSTTVAGTITMDAQGATAVLTVNNPITSANGTITLKADDDVIFSAAGDVTSTLGNVAVTADDDATADAGAGGALAMVDGTVINAGSGTIALAADENITLGGLVTTNNTGTAVTLTSASGAIVDGGATDVDVVAAAGRLVIDAVTGVGSGAALETTVASLDIDNATSGNIDIAETDDVTVFKAAQATAGSIQVVSATGAITVDNGGAAANAITAVGAGTVTLTANAGFGAGNVTINDGISTVAGGTTVTVNGFISFAAEGDITSTSGFVTLFAGNGVVTMVDGTVINAGSGIINIRADGNLTIGRLVTTDTSDAAVTLEVTVGGVIDGGATGGVDVEATGGRLVIDSRTGVGSEAALETTVASLDIDNLTTGNIDIAETDAVTIVKAVQGTTGNIQVVAAAGTITVDSAGSPANAISTLLTGTVTLDAIGAASDVVVNDGISTASGTITVTADNDITFAAEGDVSSTSGNVSFTADADATADAGAGGALAMVDGTVINAGSGTIALAADENITLGGLVTTNNTGTAVTLTSASGAVVDGGATDVDVVAAAGTLVIDAVTGVGSGAALETTVAFLDIDNTTSGNIEINETDAVDVNKFASTVANDGNPLTGAITLVAGGLIENRISNISAIDGNITLTGTGQNTDVSNFEAITTTNTGGVTITADDTTFFDSASSITASGSGNVSVTANADNLTGNNSNVINVANGAVIDAGSGTITLTVTGANAGEIRLGRLVTTSSSATAVTLATGARVIDVGDTGGVDVEAPNGGLVIDAVTGVGVTLDIETTVASLDIENTTVGGIFINETDAVSIVKAVQGTAGNITVVAGGSITVALGGAGVSAIDGNIVLDANGQNVDVIVQAAIATTLLGAVTITADDTVFFDPNGSVTASGSGNVSLTANTAVTNGDSDDRIEIQNGAVIDAGSGTILLQATGANGGDIRLGRLVTTSTSATAVTLATAAAVTDLGDTGGVDVEATGGTLVIDAVTGVGSGAALETTVASLDVDNVGVGVDGNIEIIETDAVIVIELDNDDPDDTNAATGIISLVAGSDISVTTTGISAIDGNITVASAAQPNGDVFIQAPVTTTLLGGVTVTAQDDVTFTAAGDVTASGSGNISVTADSDAGGLSSEGALAMVDGTVINAGSGTITLAADENITLGGLVTTNATTTAVTLTSKSGAVVDGGATDVDVVAAAGRLVIDAVTGVGSGAGSCPIVGGNWFLA